MNAQTLPYLLVYLSAFIVGVVVFFYAWRNRTGPGIFAFAVSMALEMSWLVGYVIEVNAGTLGAKVFWDDTQFIGAFYAPIALLVFALHFTGRKVNTRWLSIALGVIPTVILFFVFTGIQPELIRLDTQVLPGVPYDELNYEYGTLTNYGNYFLYVVSLAYLAVLIAGFRRRERNFRTQLWLVLLGTGIPIVGLILGQFLGFKFANQRDISPLLFVISNAVIAFGVFRFRLFSILPIAREALFETIEDVLIILDIEDVIVDANKTARRFLSAAGPSPIGIPLKAIFPELYSQFSSVTEISTEIAGADNRFFDMKITPLYDRSKEYIGRLIFAHDITGQKNAQQESLTASEQNRRRAAQFQAIANVASATTTLQGQEQTLSQVVQTISEQLGHYHVSIFFLDDTKRYAILKAANSTGGRRMLERGHSLEVGEKGIVGNAASTGRARIALDTGADTVYFDNPDLPETRSEVALPLMQGREIIGVLDVQSTIQDAFSQDHIETLSILANQVSVTIQNTRLYEENVTALANAEKAYRQLTGETWREVLQSLSLKGYVYDGVSSQPLTRATSGHSVSIPVTVRGQNIGALKLEALETGRTWTDDELAIITAAAERAALALENARLLAESRKRAAKERAIGEISAKISAQSDIDELLKTAALELNRTLPGTEIAIQFQPGLDEKAEDHRQKESEK
jgi:GAF domain-containing protein/PAS domain-containing protein